jgi:hypothetical protein
MSEQPEQEDLIVTTVDEVSDVAHAHDEPRKLSDYKPTNMPLSQFEIEHDEARDTAHEGWAPRTTENIGDMTPLPERPVVR